MPLTPKSLNDLEETRQIWKALQTNPDYQYSAKTVLGLIDLAERLNEELEELYQDVERNFVLK